MGQVLALMLLLGTIGVVVSAVAPFLVFLIIAAGITWMLVAVAQEADKQRNAKLMQKFSLLNRADKQHNQIMSGNLESGTYGIYQPPKGLR